VLLNAAQYLNGKDIHSLKISIAIADSDDQSAQSLDAKFDDIVKKLVAHRLAEFDPEKNKELFEMNVDFIKKTNSNEYIKTVPQNYWIYDMLGAEDASLQAIGFSEYQEMGDTDWHRADHCTFLTTQIFQSGNLFLIINILQCLKVNEYSLTSHRGSSTNQIDKVLLRLVMSFASSIRHLFHPKLDSFETHFLEFAYFYLSDHIAFIRHNRFQHMLLSKAFKAKNVERVKMLRTKCHAPLEVHSENDSEAALFATFKTATSSIFSSMQWSHNCDARLLSCLRECYSMEIADEADLLDTFRLDMIANYTNLPQISSNQRNSGPRPVLAFWEHLQRTGRSVLRNEEAIAFVAQQIQQISA